MQTFTRYDAGDVTDPTPVPTPTTPEDAFGEEGSDVQGNARDCGDFADRCKSGYTFFRRDTQVRSAGDQSAGATDDTVYVVYDPTKPGAEVDTDTTYGSLEVGRGSQSAVYFLSFHGTTGAEATGPILLDDETWGTSSSRTSRPTTACCTPFGGTAVTTRRTRRSAPSGTTARGISTSPSTCSRARPRRRARRRGRKRCASPTTRATRTSNSSTVGRSRSPGTIPDENEATGAEFPGPFLSTGDVKQCRAVVPIPATKKSPETKTFGPDTCPFDGGLDQNIYGATTP